MTKSKSPALLELTAIHMIDEIKDVFPAKRPADCLPLVNSDQGFEPYEVASQFSDKDDWTALAPEWLDQVPHGMGSALSFLSDKAICFYVPAFLVADLNGWLERVDPIFHLTHGFADSSRDFKIRKRESRTWTDLSAERWRHLTQGQVAAVAHYLEWRIEKDGPSFALDAIQALGAYWYQRAAV